MSNGPQSLKEPLFCCFAAQTDRMDRWRPLMTRWEQNWETNSKTTWEKSTNNLRWEQKRQIYNMNGGQRNRQTIWGENRKRQMHSVYFTLFMNTFRLKFSILLNSMCSVVYMAHCINDCKMQLYKRFCSFVGLLVRPWVRQAREFK